MDSNRVQRLLSGPSAFYHHKDYVLDEKALLSQRVVIADPIYSVNSERVKYWCQENQGVNFLHSLVGKIIVPASWPSILGEPRDIEYRLRKDLWLEGQLKIKRISVAVDGELIDALIVGYPENFDNKRWVLGSLGNAEFCAQVPLYGQRKLRFSRKMEANLLLFNYPGVGASEGKPCRKKMIKAYRAMLAFLEDEKEGVGAKQIIGYGYSIGSAVQAEALVDYPFQEGVQYAFVRDRSFSHLRKVPGIVLGFLAKALGWDFDGITASVQSDHYEVITQYGAVKSAQEVSLEEIKNGKVRLLGDGIISVKASLIKGLEPFSGKLNNKRFLVLPEAHTTSLSDDSMDLIVSNIKSLMPTERTN